MSAESRKDACGKAIAAHAAWKAKFKKLLDGTLEIDGPTTRRSDVCEFGKWLAAPGTRNELGTDFTAIDAAHKAFHVVAATVVDAYKAGKVDAAATSLGLNGDFTRASSSLTALIVKARDKP